MPIGTICEQLRLVFEHWGLPQAIKIDNGRPFGDPKRLQIPLLPLWLVGYGIEPIWNRAAQPTDNAKVERAQATTANWADLDTCSDLADLRQKMAGVILTQRERYPVRRLNQQTRQQAYPELILCYVPSRLLHSIINEFYTSCRPGVGIAKPVRLPCSLFTISAGF